MKPRDWAAIGFRLLAIYLFMTSVYWFVSTLFCTLSWIFSEGDFDGRKTVWFEGAMMAFVHLVQFLALGYWYWFGAYHIARPLRTDDLGREQVESIAPLCVLVVAVWGVLHWMPAINRLQDIWVLQNILYQGLADWWESPHIRSSLRLGAMNFIAAFCCAIMPRIIVDGMLKLTPLQPKACVAVDVD